MSSWRQVSSRQLKTSLKRKDVTTHQFLEWLSAEECKGMNLHLWILTRQVSIYINFEEYYTWRTLFNFILLFIAVYIHLLSVQTQLLESLLIKEYGGSEDSLLGELQFAFISFLVCTRKNRHFPIFNFVWYLLHWIILQMGQSLEAFLQWKSLVSLLFGCTEAVSSVCAFCVSSFLSSRSL